MLGLCLNCMKVKREELTDGINKRSYTHSSSKQVEPQISTKQLCHRVICDLRNISFQMMRELRKRKNCSDFL